TAALSFTAATVTVAGGDKTLDEASASGIAENYAWLYNAGAGSYQLIHAAIPFALQSVPAYHGVWYRAYTSATLNLPKPAGALSVRPRAAVTRQPSAQDWAIPVVATIPAENVSDSATVLGVHPNAAAVTHIQSPPNPSRYVDVYFPPTDGQAGPRYATDFVASLGGARTWDLVVDTDIPDAEVVLSFPDLTELPRGHHVFLVDTDAGTRQSLRTRASYRFPSGAAGGERRFSVEVTIDGAGALTVSGVSAVPTRGRGVDIAFDLSQPARVQVEILNAAGRRLGVIAADGMLPRGRSAVLWSGRSAQGTQAPTGVYLVRVRASADDGQTVSGVTAFALTR
ncbi:MAG: FlgD immunoglobulin-like domain containing protein, partial [Armatimonadota bacterium]